MKTLQILFLILTSISILTQNSLSAGSIYKPIDSLESKDSLLKDVVKANFDYIEKTSNYGSTNIKKNSYIIADLGSVVFDVDDMSIRRYNSKDFRKSASQPNPTRC